MRIKEVMNKAVAIDQDMTIGKAAKIMSEKNIGSLVAVKKDSIIGILTEKDIVDNIQNLNKKVSLVMLKKVITIESDEELDNAAILMKKNKIKRLPVIEDGKLVGIITATDLIAHSDDINEEYLFD